MSTLYTCYSPKGEKFELSKANYMDCTTHHGFTTTPPSDVAFDESEMDLDDELFQDKVELENEEENADEAASEDADEGEEEVVDEATDEGEEEVAIEQEVLSFENAGAAKDYLRSKGVQFDGRLSLADLTDLANGKVAE